jgi:hypothetical protein
MTKLLTADFRDAAPARAAVAALLALGFSAREVEIFSVEPVDLPGGLLERPSRMPLAAVAGAATLLVLTILFVRYAQYDYPVATGGMPLFSWWATGVIFYEFIMFGAIASGFMVFLWESGLLERRSVPPPVPGPERIHVRVSCAPERASAADECLRNAGAAGIETMETRP